MRKEKDALKTKNSEVFYDHQTEESCFKMLVELKQGSFFENFHKEGIRLQKTSKKSWLF